MTWTKLGDEFGPESAELTDGEFRTHVEALIYSNWRLLDLYVPKAEVRRFAGSADVSADIDGLIAKDWWKDAGPNWYIGMRFAEWQRDRAQVETRRAYLAEAQRRKRAHESGDHSRCLQSAKCRRPSTVDSTVDPGRDGTVTGNAVRPKVNSEPQPVASPLPPKAADEVGISYAAEHEVREREARANEGSPKAPSPESGDGSNTVVHDDQQNPDEVLAGASHQTVTRARGGRPPLPEPTKQMILSLSAQGEMNQAQIARQAGVARSTVHKVLHQVAS